MSHVVTTEIQYRNLDALEIAGKRCGVDLCRGQSTYRWWGYSVGDYPIPEGMTADQLGHCQHALSVPNQPYAYEAGLIEQSDGSYRIIYDFYGGGGRLLTDCIGVRGEKLESEYKKAVIEMTCDRLGWYREMQSDGSAILYLPDGGMVTITSSGEIEAHDFIGSACELATMPLVEALGRATDITRKPEYTMVKQDITI